MPFWYEKYPALKKRMENLKRAREFSIPDGAVESVPRKVIKKPFISFRPVVKKQLKPDYMKEIYQMAENSAARNL